MKGEIMLEGGFKRHLPGLTTDVPFQRPTKSLTPTARITEHSQSLLNNKRVALTPDDVGQQSPSARGLLLQDHSREVDLVGSTSANASGLVCINVSSEKSGCLTASWSILRSFTQLQSVHNLCKLHWPANDMYTINPVQNLNMFLSLISMNWKCIEQYNSNLKSLLLDFFSEDILGSNTQEDAQNLHPNASPRSAMLARHTKEPSSSASLEDFSLLKLIGKGSFGEVFLAQRKSDHSTFAIKALGKADMIRRKQCERLVTERLCMIKVNSPFVVQLETTFATPTHVFFVQTLCQAGELYFHLDRREKLCNKLARFYIAECALALQAMHDVGIVYRDLKPENIMIDAQGHIKLVDFGLAKLGVENALFGASSFVGTSEYLSPEMIARQRYGFAVDWWGLGMVFYEMLTGLPPWFSQDRKQVARGIAELPVEFPHEEVSPDARSLIRLLLEKDPKRRLGSWGGINQIEQQPFFSCLDFAKLREKRLKPPYVPTIKSNVDVSYFDVNFTKLAPVPTQSTNPDDDILIRKAEREEAFKYF